MIFGFLPTEMLQMKELEADSLHPLPRLERYHEPGFPP